MKRKCGEQFLARMRVFCLSGGALGKCCSNAQTTLVHSKRGQNISTVFLQRKKNIRFVMATNAASVFRRGGLIRGQGRVEAGEVKTRSAFDGVDI